MCFCSITGKLIYHTIASSSANTKTKGVAVVSRCNYPMKVLDIWADSAGRITMVKVDLYGLNFALAPVYAPNTFDKDFSDDFMQQMLGVTMLGLC